LRRQALIRATAILAPSPTPMSQPCQPGIAVAGEFSRASGLGEGARLMADAAERAGMPVWRIDIPALAEPVPDLPPPQAVTPHAGTRPHEAPPPGVPLVVHVNPPLLPLALLRLPQAVRRDRPVVGYWAWELAQAPPCWRHAARCVNAVWAPSRFVAAALRPVVRQDVTVVPPPLADAETWVSGRDRASFGLPQDALMVLTSCSLAAGAARKNPFAAIAAFRAAFGDRADRVLVLKLTHGHHSPADLNRIAGLTAGSANIILLDQPFSRADARALTACADIVVSLHRAEGFGLVPAEAMLCGKPVIATGWSGNTDYMTDANAILIPGHLTPAREHRALYHGLWAEPDVMAAADWLTRLAENPGLRARLGQAASRGIRQSLTAEPLFAALRALG